MLRLLVGMFFLPAAVADDQNTTVYATSFMLQQKAGDRCLGLEVADVENNFCVYQDPEVNGLCYPRNRVVFDDCSTVSQAQRWRYNTDSKQVYYAGYSRYMCLSRMVETLEMLPCTSLTRAQSWRFDERHNLVSEADKSGEPSFLTLISGGNYAPVPVTFRFVDAEMGERRCYLSPLTGKVECEISPEPEPKQPEPGDGSSEEDSSEKGSSETDSTQPVRRYDWNDPQALHWVSSRLTADIELHYSVPNVCLKVQKRSTCEEQPVPDQCYTGADVYADYCSGEDDSVWKHDLKTKRIFNRMAGYHYCLSWLHGQLTIQSCFDGGSPAQKWYFSKGEKITSAGYGRLKSMAKGIQEPYAYLDVLGWPEDLSVKRHRLTPAVSFGYRVQMCGYHPVTGKWITACQD